MNEQSKRFEPGSAPTPQGTRSSKHRLAIAFFTAAAIAAVVPALGYSLLHDDGPPVRKALPVPRSGVEPERLFSLTTSWGDQASIWSALTSSERAGQRLDLVGTGWRRMAVRATLRSPGP